MDLKALDAYSLENVEKGQLYYLGAYVSTIFLLGMNGDLLEEKWKLLKKEKKRSERSVKEERRITEETQNQIRRWVQEPKTCHHSSAHNWVTSFLTPVSPSRQSLTTLFHSLHHFHFSITLSPNTVFSFYADWPNVV